MNVKSITYVLGWILKFEGAFLLLPVLISMIYREIQGWAFLFVAVLCATCGLLLTGRRPKNPAFYAKEGFVATALSWVVMSVFGCLPFILTGEIPDFIDALFETVSGFTTTGASILPAVEHLSHTALVWRSFTHWIGGMGVLVFLLAVLPMVGGTNMQLMKAESPGPSVSKLVPRVRYTAQILYRLYIVLTVLQFVLLLFGGMSPFEAMCTAFGTAGTGGFGIMNDSMVRYSPYIQWVTTIFMIIFGVNFNVYFLILMGKFRQAGRCEEMRWYLGIIAVASLLIFVNIYDAAVSAEANLRASVFQVASIITTTGFATVNFAQWPTFSRVILLILMFMGACAGSTGGGFKVSRFMIASKAMTKYLRSFLHPRAINKIRFEEKDVDDETLRSVLIYFFTLIAIYVISTLLVSLENNDLVTTISSTLATLSNVGPALGKAGPMSNFAAFSPFSKAVMIFDMLAGRLELFPLLMLLYPPLWKETVQEARRRKRRREALSGTRG